MGKQGWNRERPCKGVTRKGEPCMCFKYLNMAGYCQNHVDQMDPDWQPETLEDKLRLKNDRLVLEISTLRETVARKEATIDRLLTDLSDAESRIKKLEGMLP